MEELFKTLSVGINFFDKGIDKSFDFNMGIHKKPIYF